MSCYKPTMPGRWWTLFCLLLFAVVALNSAWTGRLVWFAGAIVLGVVQFAARSARS